MATKPISQTQAVETLDIIHEVMGEGYPLTVQGGSTKGAIGEAASRMGLAMPSLRSRLHRIKSLYGLEPDPARYRPEPAFTIDDLPHDGEPDAETLIAALKAKHAQRKEHDDARKLRDVRVSLEGPIAVAFFGDPHVDDPGCAWGDLERDVSTCRNTEGMLAADVGDDSNNWVGRLARLYAEQEVTSRQALTLIEWLMTSLPWLLRVKGNHDGWNTEKGDPADFIHRMHGSVGALEAHGARLRLNLPGGASCIVNVRHDFPGQSQFNGAHALVRETLFNYRDHILACGHRHTSAYMPIWHNDPPRLCHGFRVGAYKDFDHYAREKGFREGNWARAMAALIDPDFANDPVRFVKPFFSLEECAEYLTWRRGKWSTGKTAA